MHAGRWPGRPDDQYVAAGLIGLVGLAVAALIYAAGALAGGGLPTAPTSYEVQLVRFADTGF
ncbi:hypothetical protein ACQPZP_13400 [Spirillospora sp. CA-142024]|uniref:hypothetical protein n=1 Tax=Spirillospora sp. CA-142024 TaxID=3240036 RepID=UPI003D8EE684